MTASSAEEAVVETKKETKEAAEPESMRRIVAFAMSTDAEWPDAWIMSVDNNIETGDRSSDNRCDPNIPVTAETLKKIGICFWKMKDTEKYEYPITCVPWDPSESADPVLKAVRESRGYSYADIITIHPDHLGDFEMKTAMFYQEHIHDEEEIRFVLSGSGFFDVRDDNDQWVRVHVKKGDLITLPEGIYHRFTLDKVGCCHLMRLFRGHPVWTSLKRPQDRHPSRISYVQNYLRVLK